MNNESEASLPPRLLNEDGTASMATMLLMSHHAFRRDIARFIHAVAEIRAGEKSRMGAVREEWEKSYRQALHGHHTMEDMNIFPDIVKKYPELAPAIEKLMADHHRIDPVLERGDSAFADLTHPDRAAAVLDELKALLDQHLTFEEAKISPSLRDTKEFPAPADDTMAAMYADGFSWSMQGIAPEVLEAVQKMLPSIVLAKLPDARAAFEERSRRTWGTYATGSTTTPIPSGY